MPEPRRLDYLLRVFVERLEDVDAVMRDSRLEFVHIIRPKGAEGALQLDVLAPKEELTRLQAAGWRAEILSHVLQPEDLPTQVSQTDRWAAEVKRLRDARK